MSAFTCDTLSSDANTYLLCFCTFTRIKDLTPSSTTDTKKD